MNITELEANSESIAGGIAVSPWSIGSPLPGEQLDHYHFPHFFQGVAWTYSVARWVNRNLSSPSTMKWLVINCQEADAAVHREWIELVEKVFLAEIDARCVPKDQLIIAEFGHIRDISAIESFDLYLRKSSLAKKKLFTSYQWLV